MFEEQTLTTTPIFIVELRRTSQRKEMADGIDANERFQLYKTVYSLDENLSQGMSLSITKGTKNPAGTFTLTLIDVPIKMDDGSMMFSNYDNIEPMDIIEIRGGQNYDGDRLPIIMRGFVTSIDKEESIGSSGIPQRTVRISGHDYGKIFQMIQIIYINNSVVGDNILHSWMFAQKYDTDKTYSNPSASEFIAECVDKVAQNFIKNYPWDADEKIKPFKNLTANATSKGRVSSQQVNQWPGGGSIYALIAKVCDVQNGFNEFFTVDDEEDVKVVLRPTPYIKPDGELLAPSSQEKDWFPEDVTIEDSDIISINISRSDEQTSNYFWVKNPSFMLQNDMYMKMDQSFVNERDYRNCDARRYGVRMMESTIFLGAPDGQEGNPSSETQPSLYITEEDWKQQHINILKEVGKNAIVFEKGTMRIKGNEKIKAGGFLYVQRRNLKWKCYIQQVTHTYEPFTGFFSTITFTQGTGYIARGQLDKPFLNEKGEFGSYGKPPVREFENYDSTDKYDESVGPDESVKVVGSIEDVGKK